MLIATLLVLLGVSWIVIIIFGGSVLERRRWIKRQPGVFTGAIRLTSGQADGISPKWKRGSGRWVRDVLVWSNAPFLFRTDVIGVDQLSGVRHAPPDEVKRIGDQPVVAEFLSGTATIAVATSVEHRDNLVGPWSTIVPGGSV